MCPWREPESDLKLFFPDATRYSLETRILSGQRLELAERLGRSPTGDENSLQMYRICGAEYSIGEVLTRRVKGGYGAIELVLAVGTDGKIKGLRLQRLREPESVAAALQSPEWLQAFAGRSADSDWRPHQSLPKTLAEASPSAEAVIEGVRSLLILLAVADKNSQAPTTSPRHH